jgi:hypothetical protein
MFLKRIIELWYFMFRNIVLQSAYLSVNCDLMNMTSRSIVKRNAKNCLWENLNKSLIQCLKFCQNLFLAKMMIDFCWLWHLTNKIADTVKMVKSIKCTFMLTVIDLPCFKKNYQFKKWHGIRKKKFSCLNIFYFSPSLPQASCLSSLLQSIKGFF